ncbi:glycosyltransferase family 9 protein [Hymenobacter negativus]|uniref:Glycosyltransferase family 9 protein n=1 Tax=Hymenobacter negativus TaxID=2795026 RepID=A0ABS3QM47_9BACT|nr:glycosyltransferase family 9 protein [Hymenobacter negativus]MBO2012343.1 glycosyltransferase family 9 protein [Hymenobacter negativus]
MSPETPFTFLVSRTDAIGDVVLTLPVCGRLKQLFPGCRVVLIGRTYTAAVAAACPWVDDFLNLDELQQQNKNDQVATLRDYAAAAIIHVFPNKTLARLAQKAKIPLRIGTRNRWQHWLTCNRLVALSRRHSPLHEAQLNPKLLQPLGDTSEPTLPEVAQLVCLHATELLAPQHQQLLQQRQPNQLNVILHPRSRGSAREWGLDNFAQLARLLHQAGHRVFITGTAAEGEELATWLQQNAAFLAADLTGQLSLPQFIAFIAAADGLVAGSTGPLHLAAALGRHALGLYPPIRPMHPGRWAPLGPHAEFLVFDKPNCSDCRKQPSACTCIRAIEAATVAARVANWQPLTAEQ